MKNKLLAIIATLAVCFTVFAERNMCIHLGKQTVRYNVSNVESIFYEAVDSVAIDTVYVTRYMNVRFHDQKIKSYNVDKVVEVFYEKVDSTAIDASNIPLKFNITSDSTAEVVGCDTSYIDSVNIPAKVLIDGLAYDVTSIGVGAFSNNKKLRKLNIPSSLAEIKLMAISNCDSLVEINVDMVNSNFSSVNGVLYDKNKTELILVPDAYKDSVKIPSSVKKIAYGALLGKSGADVVIYNSRNDVNMEKAGGVSCKSLKFDGCPLLFDVSTDSTKATVKKDAMLHDAIKKGMYGDSLAIPAELTMNGKTIPVVEIDAWTFTESKGLKFVEMPNIVSIGECAFMYTSLADLKMPAVERIGAFAFQGCEYLTNKIAGEDTISLNLPSVAVIENYAFEGCTKLLSVEMPKLTTIGEEAFAGCQNLSNVKMPQVTEIGAFAFQGSGLTKVDLPSTVISIGCFAFDDCSEAEITIDNSKENIKLYDYEYNESSIDVSGAFGGVKSVTWIK